MGPAILFVVIFLLAPVGFNVYASLTQWAKFSGFDQFAGLANYQRLASNPKFLDATLNTTIWLVVSFVLPAVLGLSLALLVRGVKGQETFKSIFFLPRMFSATAVGVIWYYVYANEGVVNSALRGIGLESLTSRWLYETNLATPAMIVTHLWQQVGLMMVLLLLGLNALPTDPIEAARVDGASRWQVFRHIVLPLLMPTILVVVTVSVLAGFTSFDLVWVMGRDYPNRSTLTLAVNQYWESFRAGSWAYGAAIAVVLGAIALSISWSLGALQQRLDKR
jgi:ABC-type sugar transport system permease subunit